MSEAYQLYTNANHNFEAAMNMHFNGTSTSHNQFESSQVPAYNENYEGNFGYG